MAIHSIEQGEMQLAVPIGQAGTGKQLTHILALKTSPGWNVAEGSIAEWRFQGVMEKDGQVLLYGPPVGGVVLESVIGLPLPSAIPYLARLVEALQVLRDRQVPSFPFALDSVLFPRAGGVVFLPPEVFREIRAVRTFESTRDCFEVLNHPDRSGEALASFAIAAILYRVSTGRFPFTGDTAEEIHEQVRKLQVVPPDDLSPGLDPEVSAMVMAGLGRSRRAPAGLGEWFASLADWEKRAILRHPTTEERERALRESGSRRQVSEKSFHRRLFWEKNWKIVAIVAAAVICVGVVLGSIVRNVTAPRPTKGFPPEKVVETFYAGMNSLDHTAMQACVVGAAGQGEINETITLFVTSRVVMGYEGKANIVSAAEWDSQGRPKLDPGVNVYGVTGLSLTREQGGDSTPVFLARYEKWSPASAPDTGKMPSGDEQPRTQEQRIVDRVLLKKDRADWVIYKIERLQSEQVPLPP